jgi:hypothetical protein
MPARSNSVARLIDSTARPSSRSNQNQLKLNDTLTRGVADGLGGTSWRSQLSNSTT